MSGSCPDVVKNDKMNKLCLGTYLRTLVRNKSDSIGATQANIGRSLISWFDSDYDKDDALISCYANAKKNPNREIIRKASTLQPSNIEKFVKYFERKILPLLNPNKVQAIVRFLSIIIVEDEAIESSTIIDRISNIKKMDLKGTVDNPTEFLSGVFLYILSYTDNLEGKKEKGFVNRIISECEQLVPNYVFYYREKDETLSLKDTSSNKNSIDMINESDSLRLKELALAEERINQEVNTFCIDYSKEMQFLPLCQVISVTDPIQKHIRNMYNDFCKSTTTVQKRILSKKGVTSIVVPDNDWWYDCLDKFILDYRRFELGSTQYEYMFSQYFPRAINTWQDKPVKKYISRKYPPFIQNPITSFAKYRIDIEGIIDEYFYYKDVQQNKGMMPQPMDFFHQDLDFDHCDEFELIIYLCQIIIGTCSGVLQSRRKQHPERDGWSFPDVDYIGPHVEDAETLEDLFFITLRMLYRTYMVDDDIIRETEEE